MGDIRDGGWKGKGRASVFAQQSQFPSTGPPPPSPPSSPTRRRTVTDIHMPSDDAPAYVAGDGNYGYGQANMVTGRRVSTYYGALDAFFPALLALSGDRARAGRLEDSSYLMWNFAGVEPDSFDYAKMQITNAEYPLRPEIIESA